MSYNLKITKIFCSIEHIQDTKRVEFKEKFVV